MTIFNLILDAKRKLEENGVIPRYIRMSPIAHQWLADELSEREGRKKHRRIFEVCGLKVEIENECPSGAAYIEGEE
jgi:hypothetical protein